MHELFLQQPPFISGQSLGWACVGLSRKRDLGVDKDVGLHNAVRRALSFASARVVSWQFAASVILQHRCLLCRIIAFASLCEPRSCRSREV